MTEIKSLLTSMEMLLKALRSQPRLDKDVRAQVHLNHISDRLDSLRDEYGDTPGKTRVLVMPASDDKNTFALEAMADAMGLRIVEADVPAEEKPVTLGTLDDFKPFNSLHKEPLILTGPTDQQLIDEHLKTHKPNVIPEGVVISKKTGLPKRPYVKSGKFNAENRKAKNPRRAIRLS